ncbi:hypothetical protein QQY66_15880 [Streptomyces sp. DG2A-72]|uniref:hypothetical protein n=1 Tax=Streptomyces sp. DG2A-72 TaxID=3051386 RepID=UPI00265C4BC8|nr:hypothetical protein [Streptomyces sp. DG2A-72]MDO0933099.1 hypothetical protein [Streptomyces sp. DG2A-72]
MSVSFQGRMPAGKDGARMRSSKAAPPSPWVKVFRSPLRSRNAVNRSKRSWWPPVSSATSDSSYSRAGSVASGSSGSWSILRCGMPK